MAALFPSIIYLRYIFVISHTLRCHYLSHVLWPIEIILVTQMKLSVTLHTYARCSIWASWTFLSHSTCYLSYLLLYIQCQNTLLPMLKYIQNYLKNTVVFWALWSIVFQETCTDWIYKEWKDILLGRRWGDRGFLLIFFASWGWPVLQMQVGLGVEWEWMVHFVSS